MICKMSGRHPGRRFVSRAHPAYPGRGFEGSGPGFFSMILHAVEDRWQRGHHADGQAEKMFDTKCDKIV